MSGGIYTTNKIKTLQSLADVGMDNVLNKQAPVYDSTVELFTNQTVVLASDLPSGSSGDVIISDGAGGIDSTPRLNVNPTNGTVSGTYINITDKEVKLADGAGGNAPLGSKNISIGWLSGATTTNNDVISIGAAAGDSLAKDDSINIGRGSGYSAGIDSINIGRVSGFGSGTNSISLGYNAKANNDNCIVINSTGTNTQSQQADSCYINPVRNLNATTLTSPFVVQYDDTNKEVIKSEDLHIRDIVCRDIDNQGTLTNVSTASLYNGQLTVGVGGNKVVAGDSNNNLVVDLTNSKVAINKATPDEELDINGTLRIEADTTQTIRFYDTQGGGSPDEDGRIEVTQDAGGGEMKFYTLETGGGTPNERLSINRRGALGVSANYGNAGEVLMSNGSGSAVSWSGGSIYDLLYPVHSVFIWYSNTDWTYFPNQTWLEFAQGRTLVGRDTGDTDFNVIGLQDGFKTHTLSINEMPSHTHTQNPHNHLQTQSTSSSGGSQMVGAGASGSGSFNNGFTNFATATNQDTGGDQPHNNLQPYVVVRYYRRTA